jgi:putative membrane protein
MMEEEQSMQRKGKVVFSAMAVVFYLGVNVTFAQMDVNQAALRDRQFLQDASVSSAWLITLGNIALRQAASADIKNFSKMMIRDQGQIDGDLKMLAQRKGVALSGDTDPVRRNTSAFLSQEYGAAFDRNYISLIGDVHQRDAALYREETEKGLDADIRAFAGRLVKRLEEYVGMAKKILNDLPKPLLK